MTLQQQGFRFVRRDTEFKWSHPADMLASDLDCTDMSDAEFEQAVREVAA